MVAAALRAGLAGELQAELERNQPQLLCILRARVPAMFPKAYRWSPKWSRLVQRAQYLLLCVNLAPDILALLPAFSGDHTKPGCLNLSPS
jgi:hypothetical protein